MRALEQIFMLMARNSGPKETAADRRKAKNRLSTHRTAPRSMTEAEKVYYAKHKKLEGFNA